MEITYNRTDKMRTDITFMYDKKEKDYVVRGYPELKGRHGADVGDGMAIFFGEGWKNYEFYIANTLTGQIRKLATKNGDVLVGDDEIDFESIKKSARMVSAMPNTRTCVMPA